MSTLVSRQQLPGNLSEPSNEGIIYSASLSQAAHPPSSFDDPNITAAESTEAYNTAYESERKARPTSLPTTFWSREYSLDALRTIKDEDMVVEDLDLDTQDETKPNHQEEYPVSTLNLKDRLITQLAHLDMSSKGFHLKKDHPIAAGGFADIWLAVIRRKQVAIKTVRMARAFDVAAQEQAVKELHAWSRLEHSHVLKLVGFMVDSRLCPGIALISKFHPHGSAATYVVGKEFLVVLKIILGACLGLRYLHSKHVIHGDFRGDNLLISRDGEAVVADFGLSKVLTSAYHSSTEGGNPHWTAPEIFLKNALHTKMSDIWSCGMTILELFSGKIPYHNLNTGAVLMAHLNSELPECPGEDSSGLLDVCLLCWKSLPSERANMNVVTKNVQSIIQDARPCPVTLIEGDIPALTCRKLGRPPEPEELGQRKLKALQRLLRAEDPDALMAMNNLATAHREQGQLKEAEKLFQRVLEVCQRLLGAEHPNTLSAMGNLALTYDEQGRLQEAEELGQRVLEAHQRLLGDEHLRTLMAMNNLAGPYCKLGRLQEAGELQQRVLEARQRLLGAEHPNTLLAMGNLALTYGKQGRLQEAEELGQRFLEASQRLLGAGHSDTLTAMSILAWTYSELGRLQEAEELGLRVLEASQRFLGAEHPKTLTVLSNLAWTYCKLGRPQEAEELRQRVLKAKSKF